MSPLDHPTPESLFGAEACADRKALRRAYARLIKRFGPETHPEAFEHIRRLYEEARSAVQSRSVSEAHPDAVASQSGRPTAEGWLARVSVDSLEDDLASLRQDTLRTGDLDLATLLFSCVDALHPEAVPTLLAELARCPELRHACAATFASAALQGRPSLVRDPAWDRVAEQIDTPWERMALTWARMDACDRLETPAGVAALYAETVAVVQRGDPKLVVDLVGRVLGGPAGFFLSSDDIDDLVQRVSAYDFAADDDVLPAMLAQLRFLQRWRAAHDDPAVPGPVLEALRQGQGLDGLDAAVVLLELRDALSDDVLEELGRSLTTDWPVLATRLDHLICAATARSEWLSAWARLARAPWIRGEQRDGWLRETLQAKADLDRARARPPLAPWASEDTRSLLRSLAVMAAIAGLFSLGNCVESDPLNVLVRFGALLLTASVFGAPAAALTIVRQRRARAVVGAPGSPLWTALRRAVLADARREGLWSHDIATAAAELDDLTLDEVLDEILADRTIDVRLATPRHLRTVFFREAVARSAPQPEEPPS